MPDAQSIWLNPDLTVYSTEVEIDSGSQALRTGMSCRVEIVIEDLKDVIQAPLQSVVRYNGQHFVYVVPESGPPVARPVTIGYDNNRLVHIEEGVEPGELVLLAPPLHDQMEEDEKAPSPDEMNPDSGQEPEGEFQDEDSVADADDRSELVQVDGPRSSSR